MFEVVRWLDDAISAAGLVIWVVSCIGIAVGVVGAFVYSWWIDRDHNEYE